MPLQGQAASGDDYARRIARARLLVKQGNDTAASKIYEALIKQDPNRPQAYNNLAAIKARHGKYRQAQALLEQALRSNPVYATVYENLSTIYVEMARDSYGKALSLETPKQTIALRELSGPQQVKSADIRVAAATVQKQPKAPTDTANKIMDKKAGTAAPASKTSAVKQTAPPAATTAMPPPAGAAGQPDIRQSKSPSVASVKSPAKIHEKVPEQAATTTQATAQMASAKTLPVSSDADSVRTTKPVSSAPALADPNKDKVITRLQGWAAAWSDKAVDLYLGFYSADYAPRGMTHPQWMAQRRQRLQEPKWIQVALSDFQVGPIKGGEVRVRFNQEYKADNYRDRTRKQVRLRHTPDGWRIVDEIAIAVLH